MLYAFFFLTAFCIVPLIHRSNEISGDSANSLKLRLAVVFLASAVGTFIIYDSGITAARVPIHRMVDGTIADTAFLHAANHTFIGIQVFLGVSVKFNV